eukprot:4121464-Prymnesium_polylepis.1
MQALFSLADALLAPVDLLTCSQSHPLGVDVGLTFTWRLPAQASRASAAQSAYQVVLLAQNGSRVWDSGLVESSRSANADYTGPPLEPDTAYSWIVRVTTADAKDPSPYSAPARFGTGFFTAQQWASSPAPLWISGGNVFRRVFAPARSSLRRATVYVSGYYYELYVNGHRVGDHVLDPGYTDYDREALYVAYDVTTLLSVSEPNVVGMLVGNGWGHNAHYPAPAAGNAIAVLKLTMRHHDGTVDTV